MHNFKNLSRVLLGLLLLALCATSWGQTSANKPHIAVLNLEGREGVAETQAATLSDRLRGHLVNTRAFVVLDRANMEAVLSEHGFQQTGCSSTQCAVQIGKVLNVQKMITGSIGKVGKTYAINLVVINVESSRIERSFNRDYRGEIDGLLQELRTLAQEMAATLGKSAALEPKPQHKLTLDSSPRGAEVWLNNKLAGKTPFAVNVPRGEEVNVVVRAAGYEEWRKSLLMEKEMSLNVELAPLVEKSSSIKWLWIAGGVAALGTATYFILSPKENGNNSEGLPPFAWPPKR